MFLDILLYLQVPLLLLEEEALLLQLLVHEVRMDKWYYSMK